MKRKQTRIDRLRERERKEENLAHYKAEVAAEQAGVKLSEEQNSIVRMVEHGVAAQAENERKNHQATAMGGAQQSGLASTMGKDTKKNTASAPSPMLKDIMF